MSNRWSRPKYANDDNPLAERSAVMATEVWLLLGETWMHLVRNTEGDWFIDGEKASRVSHERVTMTEDMMMMTAPEAPESRFESTWLVSIVVAAMVMLVTVLALT